MCVCVYSIVSNSLQPMDSSPPVSSVHGILQARIMERVVRPSSRGSSQPRDQTCISCVSCIGRRFFTNCATWGAQNEMLHLHIKFMVWPLLRESRKTHTYTHAHTRAHTHTHACTHMHAHTCTRMHTHTCARMHTLHFVLTAPTFSPLIASEPEGPLTATQAALVRLGPGPTVLGLCEPVNTVSHPTKSISLGDLQGRGGNIALLTQQTQIYYGIEFTVPCHLEIMRLQSATGPGLATSGHIPTGCILLCLQEP